MQNHYFKICLPVFFVLLCFRASLAQTTEESLSLADSLFNQRKFTESFELYQDIYLQRREASPVMLLKMAYIQEGINNYPEALYYLNLYYMQIFDKRALRKMEELADKNNLEGYKISDLDFFRNIIYRYYNYIIISLATLTWLVFTYMVYKKRKIKARPAFSAFFLILLLTLLFIVVNFSRFDNQGLLVGKTNFLMEGPSPGSRLIDVVKNGHRIRILNKEGLWYKIKWKDQDVYVRDRDVRIIDI